MSKFQVGDVVRRVVVHNAAGDGSWVLPVGQQGVVWEVTEGGWVSLVTEGVPMYATHDPHYFELVSREESELSPARANDPATSKSAAKAIKPKRTSIKTRILHLLEERREGLTGQEIAEYTGYRLNSITPRFAELSRKTGSGYMLTLGAIKPSGLERNGQTVWVLV